MKPSFLVSLFGAFFAFLFFPTHAGAWTEVARPGIDDQVSSVSNVMNVTSTTVETITNHSSGFNPVLKCSMEGELMKGGKMFPVGNYTKDKPLVIYMVDMSKTKGPPPCYNGMSGVVMFYDPSTIGLTSYSRQGLY